ncbi:hypothetical protein [Erwinia rhapontici]|nr:hypothetical protein [Erwinia rhapontici]MBP2154271.1 DNA-binding transcriptional LysR family regulator [Erwinia rhapontici]
MSKLHTSPLTVLDDINQHQGTFRVLWPSSEHLAPKLRAFIDYIGAEPKP